MKCLLIGKVWPEPTATAAGRRTSDVIEVLQSCGGTVHFASAAQRPENALDLESIDVPVHHIAMNDSGFDAWLAELKPEVVVFDRFMTEEQYGWRVAAICPSALRILDTSDLHCLRLAREVALKSGGALNLKNEAALREIAAIYRSDLTLMISDYEMEVLHSVFGVPPSLLAYWPFSISVPELERTPSYEERRDVILIGSFMHPPNLDAARWVKQEIWSLVRAALPDVDLHCYGSYGERFAGELNHGSDGFVYKGRAVDALATMARYRVNLAPLRYGAGLKGKVFDGFLTGTPSVSTPIAAEGIFPDAIDHPNSAEAIAEALIRMYSDVSVWTEERGAADRRAREAFDRRVWFERFETILAAARDQIEARRLANFTGQMLRHHNHRSTEFMSRWIEAKNRQQ